MLLTLDGSEDNKIRPQGLSKSFLPVKVPAGVDLTTAQMDPAEPGETVTAEQQENGWTEDDAALHEGDAEIAPDDVVVEEAAEEEEGADAADSGPTNCPWQQPRNKKLMTLEPQT